MKLIYRVSHLLVDLGWVDFDLGVPLSCPAAQPLLPKFPSAQAELGRTLKIQVNPTQSTMEHPVHLLVCQCKSVSKIIFFSFRMLMRS